MVSPETTEAILKKFKKLKKDATAISILDEKSMGEVKKILNAIKSEK